MSRFQPLQTLAASLSFRGRADLDESTALFRSVFEEEYTTHASRDRKLVDTLRAGCRHPSMALAFEKAISLMQSLLAVVPTLACASYYIEIGSLERAVESLEHGRALLWSDMRSLRTPIDRLQASGHATLAEQFVTIGKQLENIAMSMQADAGARSAATFDDYSHSHPDMFSQMMENTFSKTVPFGTLQMVAACGPVIIINHCNDRSDILIVLRDSAPVLIPTAEDFSTRTAASKQLLLETQTKYPLESIDYERALRFVLGTGIADNPEPPSLLLIVGQPDPSLSDVREQIEVIQRRAPSALSLIGAKATRARVMKHPPNHRMVHFTCHGKLESERPFETAFVLHGGKRLKLLDIVRSLPVVH
ncbi:hypothetical protein BC827DRAFT_1375089 [Russula dissimulans]|nr:hypothetical protein BC827DRAFT_1375089 [Russula dissimulans]